MKNRRAKLNFNIFYEQQAKYFFGIFFEDGSHITGDKNSYKKKRKIIRNEIIKNLIQTLLDLKIHKL